MQAPRLRRAPNDAVVGKIGARGDWGDAPGLWRALEEVARLVLPRALMLARCNCVGDASQLYTHRQACYTSPSIRRGPISNENFATDDRIWSDAFDLDM